MKALTAAEREVVCMLIADDEETTAEMTRVLSPDEPAVQGVRCARDWLRAVRDTGVVGDQAARVRVVAEVPAREEYPGAGGG